MLIWIKKILINTSFLFVTPIFILGYGSYNVFNIILLKFIWKLKSQKLNLKIGILRKIFGNGSSEN